MSGPTLFEYAGVEPGPLTPVKVDGLTTYYVMVGEDGTVELSWPVVENGTFVAFAERIFVRREDDDWEEAIDPDGFADDFDVPVSFKNEGS